MKKCLLLSLIILLLISTRLEAQPSHLVNKWTMDFNVLMNEQIKPTLPFDLDTLTGPAKTLFDMQMQEMEQMWKGAYFWFKADGTVTVRTPKGNPQAPDYEEETGTWSLSEDGTIVTMVKDATQETMDLTIKEVSATRLVLSNPKSEQFKEMTFVTVK